jgi:hypothetical protein
LSVTEVLDGLGSWSLKLSDAAPDEITSQLGFLGHIAIVRGRVDVAATSASLLAAARYVGVLRERSKDRRTLEGDGMLFWLGDEDDKGKILETAVNLSAASISTAVSAVLPPAVHAGTINTAAGTYTGKHQYETPRSALDTITQAFGVEYRVNGSATIDVGTQAQLYRTTPNTIIAAKNAGADMDLTSLGAEVDVDESIRDYSTRVLLLGSSSDNGTTTTFATGSANAPSVPYLDMWGNTVQLTRMISESATPQGSVTARAQLQLNRFNRQQVKLTVTASDYEVSGPFNVGDNAYVYDPANGIYDTARSIDFRGELIHPDVVRISGATWPVTDDHTVAFRTQAGAWVDLTPWVLWETGGGEITVGDLPKSLTGPGGIPIPDRVDSLPDDTIPTAPTGLNLTTYAVVDPRGTLSAVIRAAWTPPTVNTDGTGITDLSHYFVAWRATDSDVFETTAVDTDTIDLTGLQVDQDFEVKVAAVDRSNHMSAYSSVVSIHSAVDDVAPAAPSTPTVTNYLGQLRIAWDGLTAAAGQMPPDFNRTDVHVSSTSGFTPSSATLVDSLSTAGVSYATATYASTRYVKLIAYDNAGNASAPSGQASGSTQQVVSADIFNGAVGSAKLADLAVITAKIDDLAVNNAKIGDMSVGKLTAGTMTADVVVSGRYTTALTGARTELNAVGLQIRNSSNTLLVNLDGTNNLVTGQLQTALSGTRLIINPGNTQADSIRFYPSSGSMYATLQTRTFSGQALIDAVAGSSRGDLAGGQFGCHPLEGYVRWGAPLTTTPNSFMVAREGEAQMNGPILLFSVDERFTASSGARRVEFYRYNSSGTQVTASVLRLIWNASGFPWLAGVGANCGIVFQGSGAVGVVDNTGTATNIQASSFDFASSETTKEAIAPIAQAFDPVAVVRGAPSKKWQYIFERLRQQKVGGTVPTRFGPIVEDLPAVLRRSFTGPDGTAIPGTDLASLIGVLWGAVGQLADDVDNLQRGAA